MELRQNDRVIGRSHTENRRKEKKKEKTVPGVENIIDKQILHYYVDFQDVEQERNVHLHVGVNKSFGGVYNQIFVWTTDIHTTERPETK